MIRRRTFIKRLAEEGGNVAQIGRIARCNCAKEGGEAGAMLLPMVWRFEEVPCRRTDTLLVSSVHMLAKGYNSLLANSLAPNGLGLNIASLIILVHGSFTHLVE